MDADAEKQKLEDAKAFVQGWLEHPITAEMLHDNEMEQNAAINLICNGEISSIGAFFSHFEAVGHLRGLRRGKALALDKLDDIEQQIKELD